MVAIRVKTKVRDRGPGFRKVFDELGGLGTISLGVQGKEAAEAHTNSELPIGAVAAIHELGLAPNAPKRSWLVSWIDKNRERMLKEARAALRKLAKGKVSRKKVFGELGYKWVTELRDNIDRGGVGPALAASTIKAKGHGIPMLESGDVRDSITYKLYLPRRKAEDVRFEASVAAASRSLKPANEVKGMRQPPKKRRPGTPGLASLIKAARSKNGIAKKARGEKIFIPKVVRAKAIPRVGKRAYAEVARLRARYLRRELRAGLTRGRLRTAAGGGSMRLRGGGSMRLRGGGGGFSGFLVRAAAKALRRVFGMPSLSLGRPSFALKRPKLAKVLGQQRTSFARNHGAKPRRR